MLRPEFVVGAGFDLHLAEHAAKKFRRHETADLFDACPWLAILTCDGTVTSLGY